MVSRSLCRAGRGCNNMIDMLHELLAPGDALQMQAVRVGVPLSCVLL